MSRSDRKPLPRVVRLYFMSALLGFLAAAVFVAMILAFNVANLRVLILGSDMGVTATVAFWILNGIVFSGVQFGYSIMQLGRDE
jgi:hypothetical protein